MLQSLQRPRNEVLYCLSAKPRHQFPQPVANFPSATDCHVLQKLPVFSAFSLSFFFLFIYFLLHNNDDGDFSPFLFVPTAYIA